MENEVPPSRGHLLVMFALDALVWAAMIGVVWFVLWFVLTEPLAGTAPATPVRDRPATDFSDPRCSVVPEMCVYTGQEPDPGAYDPPWN